MRSQIKRISRSLAEDELDSKSAINQSRGDRDLNDPTQKISIVNVSLEKRREEASKPLYLVRYE
jgi:hypothetical protein